MRDYELVLVMAPQEQKTIDIIVGKIKKELEADNGQVVKEESLGKKVLAYRMKHQSEGVFHFFELSLDPVKVINLEKRLKMEERLLRYLLVKSEEVGKKSEMKRAKKEAAKEKKAEVKEAIEVKGKAEGVKTRKPRTAKKTKSK